MRRGEVWLHHFRAPDKRRPVVILSRDDVIGLIDTVMVAPVTSTLRGIPSQVAIGVDEGLKHVSAVSLDHVQTVRQSDLRNFLGSLGRTKMREVCRALAIAAGCSNG